MKACRLIAEAVALGALVGVAGIYLALIYGNDTVVGW